MSQIVNQMARRTPPGASTSTVTSGTSTAAINLSSAVGRVVILQAHGTRTHYRFGTSAVTAAVATDISMDDGDTEEYYITEELSYFRAITDGTAGTVEWAITG